MSSKKFFKAFTNLYKGSNEKSNETDETNKEKIYISAELEANITEFNGIFTDVNDIVYRKFKFEDGREAALIFIKNMIDIKLLQSAVLKPLTSFNTNAVIKHKNRINELITILEFQVITSLNIKKTRKIGDIIDSILSGETVLIVDGIDEALSIGLPKLENRSIDESDKEPIIRGPHDSFVENIDTNITLIRRRIKTPALKVWKTSVGKVTKTQVAILYMDSIADNGIVTEVKKRISKIDVDSILENCNIEELIEDSKFSIFPQLNNTERPDKLAANLLEGHVGILTDNTPSALIAPQTLFQMMQSPDDYSERYITSSFIRFMRFVYLVISLLLPSLYIALTTFHQALIPANLLLTMAAAHENIPFPSLIEALIMEVFFEGLREAGVRLPRAAGQAVSIVGALIIGQAAVQAGIISAPMVIIVSVTGISSFIIPSFSLGLSFRILRFVFMILGGVLGIYGIYMGILVLLINMCRLRTFGVPYLSPLFPIDISSLKDSIIRLPRWRMVTRPDFISQKNNRRKKSDN